MAKRRSGEGPRRGNPADVWGKVTGVTGGSGAAITSSTNVANVNPIRYRGYYYDTDTSLYYLQSRYYDPEISRFINADGYLSTGLGSIGYNVFVYCINNGICMKDATGYDPTPAWATRIVNGRGTVDDYLQALKVNANSWAGHARRVVNQAIAIAEANPPDFDLYAGGSGRSGDSYYRTTYAGVSLPSLEDPAIEAEAGISTIGGNNEYLDWEIRGVTASAGIGASPNYFGFDVGASLIEGDIGHTFNFFGRDVTISLTGELFGAGATSVFTAGYIELKASFLFGGGVVIEWD